MNKIVTTLNEHHFKAAMLMRGGMLVGGTLNNSECWINMTKKDVEKLEVRDIILQKKYYEHRETQANILCNKS